MMGQSVSWTNPKTIAALLARVAGAPRPPALGSRPAQAAALLEPAPVVVPVIAPALPVILPGPRPAARREVPRLEQLSDNPSDRLDALLAWTLDNFPSSGAFVADDN